MGRNPPPQDWGFLLPNGSWNPVRMAIKPGPDDLLKVIRCNCTQQCGTKSYTCKKFGLRCTIACGNYQVLAHPISGDIAIYKDSLKKHTYVVIINNIPNCRIFCICLSFECALPLSKEILTGATTINRLRTKFSINLYH